jgi:hypothetical protein
MKNDAHRWPINAVFILFELFCVPQFLFEFTTRLLV